MVGGVVQTQGLKNGRRDLQLFVSPQLQHPLVVMSSDIVSSLHDPVLSHHKTCGSARLALPWWGMRLLKRRCGGGPAGKRRAERGRDRGRRRGHALGIAWQRWVPGQYPHPEPGMAKGRWVGNLLLLPPATERAQCRDKFPPVQLERHKFIES